MLPTSLFDKMKAAQLAGISIQYIRQVYYAKIDFTYEDRYNEIIGKGIDQTEIDLWKMNEMPYPAGSHFICEFGHLNGLRRKLLWLFMVEGLCAGYILGI